MPNERNSIDEALITALLMGTRIAPALGGLAFGGPLGGAAGGMVGETLAQSIEKYLGRREALNPGSIGVNTLLGGIPLGRVAQAGRLARMGREAAKGAGIGLAADVPLQLAETGRVDPMNTLLSMGLGAGFGSLGGIARPRPDAGQRLMQTLFGPGSEVGAVGPGAALRISAAKRRAEMLGPEALLEELWPNTPHPLIPVLPIQPPWSTRNPRIDLEYRPPSLPGVKVGGDTPGQLLLPGAEPLTTVLSLSPGSQAYQRLGGQSPTGKGGLTPIAKFPERGASALRLEELLEQVGGQRPLGDPFLDQLAQADQATRRRAMKYIEKRLAGRQLTPTTRATMREQMKALKKIDSGARDPLGPRGGFPGFENINLPGQRHVDSKELTALRARVDKNGDALLNVPRQRDLDGLWSRGEPHAIFYSTTPEQLGGFVPPQHQIAFLSDNAGFSPQSTPELALMYATLNRLREEAGLHTRGTGMATAWVNRRAIEQGILDPVTGNFARRGQTVKKGDPGWIEIGQDGLKIRNFRENLLERYDTGTGPIVRLTPSTIKQRAAKGEDMAAWLKHAQDEAVTVDTWMAALYGIDAKALVNTPKGRTLYVAMANDLRKKARAAGKTPSEYQAGIWAGIRQNAMEGGETIGGVLRARYSQPGLFPKLTIAPGATGSELTMPLARYARLIGQPLDVRTPSGAQQGVLPLDMPLGVKELMPHERQFTGGGPGSEWPAAGGTKLDPNQPLTVQDVLLKDIITGDLRAKLAKGLPVGGSYSARTFEDVTNADVFFVAQKNRIQKGPDAGKSKQYSERQVAGLPTEKDLLSFIVDQRHHIQGRPDTVVGVFWEAGKQPISDPTNPLHRWATSKTQGRTTLDVVVMFAKTPIQSGQDITRQFGVMGVPPKYQQHGFRNAMDFARKNEQFSVWDNGSMELLEIRDIAVTVNPKTPNRLTVIQDLGTPRFADESRPASTKYDFPKQQAGDFVGWSASDLTFVRNRPPDTKIIRGELIYDLHGSPAEPTPHQLSLFEKTAARGARRIKPIGGDYMKLKNRGSRAQIEKDLKDLGYQGYYKDARKQEIIWFGDAVEGWNYPWNPKGY